MRIALASIALLAGSALAAPRESATFTNVDCGVANNAGLVTNFFAGGYVPKYITISGTLTSLESATHAREAMIQVFTPSGNSFVVQPVQGTTFTSLNVAPISFAIPAEMTADAGTWSFRCLDTFDDGVRNAADARWTSLTIQLNDGAPAARDLGGITSAGININAGAIASNSVRWFRFSLDNAVVAGSGTYLDIDTVGSNGDTEIALYRADGTLVVSDDDDGPGATSQLTFGVGGRPAVSNGQPYNGRDGTLPAGTYYVSLSAYDTTFSDGWGITPGSETMSQAYLHIRSNTGIADCIADVDDGSGTGAKDGGVTIDDLLFFLQHFEGGC